MTTSTATRPAKARKAKPAAPAPGVIVAYRVKNLQCASCNAPMLCLPRAGAWPYCGRGCGRVKLTITTPEGR